MRAGETATGQDGSGAAQLAADVSIVTGRLRSGTHRRPSAEKETGLGLEGGRGRQAIKRRDGVRKRAGRPVFFELLLL